MACADLDSRNAWFSAYLFLYHSLFHSLYFDRAAVFSESSVGASNGGKQDKYRADGACVAERSKNLLVQCVKEFMMLVTDIAIQRRLNKSFLR